MKLLFAGGIHDALQRSLRELGHNTYYGTDTDWYASMDWRNETPEQWANRAQEAVLNFQPDVFVLTKGCFFKNDRLWHVPPEFLWWVKRKVKAMVFISFDCPASTPLYIQSKILLPFDLYGTTCVGIKSIFANKLPKKLKVFEFWLGHNQFLPKETEILPEYECDVVITGSPYYKPFPKPHYQSGFGFPRRDIIDIIRKRTSDIKIHIYGPATWLDEANGGNPKYKDIYKGWLHPDRIHLAHRAAKVSLATQLVRGCRYESGRCVWVGGAGGFLLHEDRPGLRDAFGQSVMWFNPGDLNHAHKQLIMALNNPHIRSEMSANLHSLIWNNHTWGHRAQTLIGEIESFINV